MKSIHAHGKTPTYGATHGHDDLMMSSIWALYILKNEFVENYFEIQQYITDKLGNSYPLFLTSFESINPDRDSELHMFIQNLDEKFKSMGNKYEISMNQLEQNIQETQKRLMNEFQSNGTLLNLNTSQINDDYENNPTPQEEDFSFSGFN